LKRSSPSPRRGGKKSNRGGTSMPTSSPQTSTTRRTKKKKIKPLPKALNPVPWFLQNGTKRNNALKKSGQKGKNPVTNPKKPTRKKKAQNFLTRGRRLKGQANRITCFAPGSKREKSSEKPADMPVTETEVCKTFPAAHST